MNRLLSTAAVLILSGCSSVLDPGGLKPGEPSTPAGLAADAGNGRVALSWTPAAGDVVRYDVYGGTTSGALAKIGEVAGAAASSHVATGLSNGVMQYFAIAAVDSAGKVSPLSTEASATPLGIPVLQLVSPGDNAANVDLDATLVVSFSHVVIPGSVTVSTIPPLDLGEPMWDSGSTSVSFATSVVAETAYTVNVACQDPAGNSTTASFHFSTIPVPPTLDAFSPTDLSTNVPVNADIQLIFSEPMTTWTSPGASIFQISPGVACTWNWAGASTIATCSHANLAFNTTYTVTVGTGATDAGGNGMAAQRAFHFTTAAAPHTLAPSVVSFSPASSATGVSRSAAVSITFNEPVDKATAQGSFTITTDGGATASGGSFSWSGDGLTMTYQPPTQNYGSNVTWTMGTGLKCLGGIAMAAPFSRSYRVIRQGTVTLTGVASLDGYLFNNTSTVYSTTPYLFAGDYSDNSYLRSFVAFDLGGLDATATAVTGATFKVYQSSTTGTPYALGSLLAQSVDYGTSLTAADFETPVLTWTGMKCSIVCLPTCRLFCTSGTWNDEYTLGTSPTAGWLSVEVAGKVERDRAARATRGNRCQFRLRFTTNTDNDSSSDYALFWSANNTSNLPSLAITYEYP